MILFDGVSNQNHDIIVSNKLAAAPTNTNMAFVPINMNGFTNNDFCFTSIYSIHQTIYDCAQDMTNERSGDLPGNNKATEQDQRYQPLRMYN
jgi:hypothetical protein